MVLGRCVCCNKRLRVLLWYSAYIRGLFCFRVLLNDVMAANRSASVHWDAVVRLICRSERASWRRFYEIHSSATIHAPAWSAHHRPYSHISRVNTAVWSRTLLITRGSKSQTLRLLRGSPASYITQTIYRKADGP